MFNINVGYSQQVIYPGCGMEDSGSSSSTNQSSASCSLNFSHFQDKHLNDMVPQGSKVITIHANVASFQRADGSGNFTAFNQDHVVFFDSVFEKVNERFANLQQLNCVCSTQPDHFDKTSFKFEYSFLEIKDEYAWNHLNDIEPILPLSTLNTANRAYTQHLNNLIEAHPEYIPGMNLLSTLDKVDYDQYIQTGDTLKNLGYSQHYGGVYYSTTSKDSLEAPANIHLPDLFLIYQDCVDHCADNGYFEGEFTDYIVGSVAHEYGHIFFGGGHPNCNGNIMHKSNFQGSNSLSGCQVRNSYQALMTRNIRRYVECEEVLDHDIVIPSDSSETWSINARVYTNVRVKPAATLKIDCELYLQPKANIIIERGGRLILGPDALISNGGICDDQKPENKWAGIKVEGNNAIPHNQLYYVSNFPLSTSDHGVILISENSTIRDASTAVSFYKYNEPWNPDYWGGYVFADSANFINNGRSFEFMKSNFDNKSIIRHCKFNGGTYGITNWESDGILLSYNEFENLNSGIYSINAGFNVFGNSFSQLPEGIGIDNMNPISSTYCIAQNSFDANAKSILGSSISNIRINNNEFVMNEFGVSLMGASGAVIKNNVFENNSVGADLQATGSQFQSIFCNDLDQNTFGLNPSGNVLGFQMHKNTNGRNTINVFDAFFEKDENGNSAIVAGQGNAQDRVLNYFSPNNDDHHLVLVSPAEVERFVYYTNGVNDLDISIPQCFDGDPFCTHQLNNFELNNEFVLSIPSISGCGTIGLINNVSQGQMDTMLAENDIPSPYDADDFSNPYDSKYISKIQTAIDSNDNGRSNISNQIGISVSDNEAAHIINGIIAHYSSSDTIQDLGVWLNQFGDYFLPLKYGVELRQRNSATARSFLTDIETYTGWERFSEPQNAYLDWSERDSLKISQIDTTQLKNYEAEDSPLSGFSRSMLNILKSDRFQPTMPDTSRIKIRSFAEQKEESSKLEYVIVPNPAQDLVTLVSKSKEFKLIEIYNIEGVKVEGRSSFHPTRNLDINLKHLKAGSYIVVLTYTDGERSSRKFIKL